MQQELQQSMPTNLETVLRLERLRLWRDVVKEDALEYILTAHHEDDQYETLIQRIAWGTGMAGLAGIPPVNEYFVRPLLAYPKVSPIQTDIDERHGYKQRVRNITCHGSLIPRTLSQRTPCVPQFGISCEIKTISP